MILFFKEKIIKQFILLFFIINFYSCEDIIDIKTDSSDPKFVIEASLNDLNNSQVIKISKTVNITDTSTGRPIDDADVIVTNPNGNKYIFEGIGGGLYINTSFSANNNGTYLLKVNINNIEFTSSTQKVPYVDIDSANIFISELFTDRYYFFKFNFVDPISVKNYYKYSYSKNGNIFKYLAVFSDRFNDGLNVSHLITEKDKRSKFVFGDHIAILRECIDEEVFTYFNNWKSFNPESVAPSNPRSNISNGALGYFSVSSAKIYYRTINNNY